MTYTAAIIVFIILIALVVGLLFGIPYLQREKTTKSGGEGSSAAPLRENYGPPPGAYRALSHKELGNRGWPSYPFEYNANTASSISHMIERSA